MVLLIVTPLHPPLAHSKHVDTALIVTFTSTGCATYRYTNSYIVQQVQQVLTPSRIIKQSETTRHTGRETLPSATAATRSK
jgi:hypothetical protein